MSGESGSFLAEIGAQLGNIPGLADPGNSTETGYFLPFGMSPRLSQPSCGQRFLYREKILGHDTGLSTFLIFWNPSPVQ